MMYGESEETKENPQLISRSTSEPENGEENVGITLR
jgi:hypothetical protein